MPPSTASSASSIGGRFYRPTPPSGGSYTGAAAAAAAAMQGSVRGGSSGLPWTSSSYRTGLNYGSHSTTSGTSGGIPGSSSSSKIVFRMDCRYCSAVVCLRGMKAMLLADTSIELYSTDHPPGSVQLVDKDYTTLNCKCRIRDVACRVCGNVVGYHITQPCRQCLDAPNNGHFWMFHTDGVVGQDRLRMDLGQLVQTLLEIYAEQTDAQKGADAAESRTASSSLASSNTTPPVSTARPGVTSGSASANGVSDARRRRSAATDHPTDSSLSFSSYQPAHPGNRGPHFPTSRTLPPQTRLVWTNEGVAGFEIGEQTIQPVIWDAWLSNNVTSGQPRPSSMSGRARGTTTAISTAARQGHEVLVTERRRRQRSRVHPGEASGTSSSSSNNNAANESGEHNNATVPSTVEQRLAHHEREDSERQRRSRRHHHRDHPHHHHQHHRSGHESVREDTLPHVLLDSIPTTNNGRGELLNGGLQDTQKPRPSRGRPTIDDNNNSNNNSYNFYYSHHHHKVLESIRNLNLHCFLQPLKWEQLPHPDFDLDLDPATMGGDPLFAAQWVSMVTQSAQTAVLNMWMALNEEFDEYHRIQGGEGHDGVDGHGATFRTLATSPLPPPPPPVVVVLPTPSAVAEADGFSTSSSTSSTSSTRTLSAATAFPPPQTPTSTSMGYRDHVRQSELLGQGVSIDRDGEDVIMADDEERRLDGLVSPDHGMFDDYDCDDYDSLEESEFESEGSDLLLDEEDDDSDDDDGNQFYSVRTQQPQSGHHAGGWRGGQVSCYYYDAATLDAIAKAAATAAAADASAAANNLVFGRRMRRDYETMCR
ncbi:Protein fam72a [Actinomortierella ambigua]|nr:Protein fam72a [Actinomortierella ambigua]